MNGLAAVWRRNGAPVDPSMWSEAAGALLPATSRPCVWIDGDLGLAHRPFAPPNATEMRYPRRDATGRIVLVADARLDHVDDLARELDLSSSEAAAIGESGLLLRAWARWGPECPRHLLGDFAFIVWDADRRMLFAARDPSGLRPLYYHLSPSLFVAASNTSALLTVPGVPRTLDEVRIASLLIPAIHDRVRTAFAAVSRLPPGHRLIVSQDRSRVEPFWELDPFVASPARTDADYAEEFRALFTDAVRERMRGAHAPAAALSGGLDSSSVVAVARGVASAAGQEPLGVYTATFPSLPAADETAFADAVVQQGGVTPRAVPSDRLNPLAEFESPDRRFETFPASGYYMHEALYRAARDDGRPRFIEGTSGDFVVAHGQGYLYDLARAGRWLACYRHARQHSRTFRQPMRRTLNPLILMAIPPRLRLLARRLNGRGLFGTSMIAPRFARHIDLDARLAESVTPSVPRGVEGVRYYHWLTLKSAKLPVVQETLAGMAARAGVELVEPFTDRRLMAFCLALPTSQKVRGPLTRIVMRHALGDVLPPVVRDRPGKTRLDVMLAAALETYGRDRLQRLLDDAPHVVGPYVRPEFIARVRQAVRGPDLMPERHAIWRLAVLTLFVRRATT